MYSEEDLLPLSALQHLLFCERQCALIHIEQVWRENRLTSEGRIMHERLHKRKRESRERVRREFDVPLRSYQLGLIGKADIVEYHLQEDNSILDPPLWLPFPVEYKRGKPKMHDYDKVQICAQALCLEEMQGISIKKGALFYGRTCHRLNVIFNRELRQKTDDASSRLHKLIFSRLIPKPQYEKKCLRCSLFEICLPKFSQRRNSVNYYLQKIIKENEETS